MVCPNNIKAVTPLLRTTRKQTNQADVRIFKIDAAPFYFLSSRNFFLAITNFQIQLKLQLKHAPHFSICVRTNFNFLVDKNVPKRVPRTEREGVPN